MKKGCSLKLDRFPTDSYLSRSRQLLDRYYISIKNYEIIIFRSDFRPMLMYLCRVSFLIILDIYKTYFKGRHIREYKENTCKDDRYLILSERSYCVFCVLGFCNQVLLDLYYWWSEELYSQQYSSSCCVSHILGAVHHWLITYWDPCKKVAFIYWRVQRF